MATLDILMEKVNDRISEYATAFANPDTKEKDLRMLKSRIKDAADAYNEEKERQTYREWNEAGDPVLTGIRERFVPRTIKVTLKPNKLGVLVTNIIYSSDSYPVSLITMESVLGDKIFASKDWFVKIEKLCFLVANRISRDLQQGIIFSDISEDAKAFSYEGLDEKAPLADVNLMAALQQVYDAICVVDDGNGKNKIAVDINKDEITGETFSAQWRYVREAMTRKAGVGILEICNLSGFTALVLDVMHLALVSRKVKMGTPE